MAAKTVVRARIGEGIKKEANWCIGCHGPTSFQLLSNHGDQSSQRKSPPL